MHQALLLTTLCTLPLAYAQAASTQPNVIIVVTDDQGYGDIEAHGNPVLKTPALNALYKGSVRLTDFHVAPMSSPTRGQLMTGMDAMHSGCTAVCQGRSMPQLSMKMMPQFFKEAGYATGHFGKWHLGDSYPYRPTDRGFDYSLSFAAWGISSLADTWSNSYFNPTLIDNGVKKKFQGYSADIFFQHAMAYIKECQKEQKPFFIYIPTNTAHVPEMVPDEYSAPYSKIGTYQGKAVPDIFYGMIANIDKNMGDLDKFLTEQGLKDNTILIYTSDNGTQNQQACKLYNAGMKGHKTSIYEGGHRVPLYIRYPEGGLSHGKDVQELSVIQDLLPTLATMCHLDSFESCDGQDLSPLLKGEALDLKDRIKVIQYRDGKKWSNTIVMQDKWRLTAPKQLYNIEQDPGQKNNIATKHPKITKRLNQHYNQWYDEMKPQFDQIRRITIGAPAQNPITLYANDWTGGYCDNLGGLYAANTQGYFDITVAEAGSYQIRITRWPIELKTPLKGYIQLPSYSKKRQKEVSQPQGAAKDICTARLSIGNQSLSLDTKSDDFSADFEVKLEAGDTRLEGVFLDAQGHVICGGIYTYILRR